MQGSSGGSINISSSAFGQSAPLALNVVHSDPSVPFARQLKSEFEGLSRAIAKIPGDNSLLVSLADYCGKTVTWGAAALNYIPESHERRANDPIGTARRLCEKARRSIDSIDTQLSEMAALKSALVPALELLSNSLDSRQTGANARTEKREQAWNNFRVGATDLFNALKLAVDSIVSERGNTTSTPKGDLSSNSAPSVTDGATPAAEITDGPPALKTSDPLQPAILIAQLKKLDNPTDLCQAFNELGMIENSIDRTEVMRAIFSRLRELNANDVIKELMSMDKHAATWGGNYIDRGELLGLLRSKDPLPGLAEGIDLYLKHTSHGSSEKLLNQDDLADLARSAPNSNVRLEAIKHLSSDQLKLAALKELMKPEHNEIRAMMGSWGEIIEKLHLSKLRFISQPKVSIKLLGRAIFN